jgi:uncharacterized protein YndB with AHSA1/START domain
MPDIEQGYLVLADISGYTGYLAATELEHANGILRDLIEQVVVGLAPPLELAGVEGDAVFAYGPVDRLSRGETLLEVIETAYAGFCDRREVMQARTTCACNACRHIDMLDLKFITHCGGYVRQELGGRHTPVGSDVTLAHRLLKNGVSAETGWRGYALFTGQALEQLGVEPAGLHRRAEQYEHLGEIPTASFDLSTRLAAIREASRPAVSDGESDWSAALDLPASPPLVWEWLNDPAKRTVWIGNRTVEAGPLPEGRTGVGAVYHCPHGQDVVDHTIVDWRPFSSFSEEVRPGAGTKAQLTWQLEPRDGGTRLRLNVALRAPLPGLVRRRICRRVVERDLAADLDRLERAIGEAAT